MGNMMDYLDWRGDLDFKTIPPNPVDALIFSELAYIHFMDNVPAEPEASVPLGDAAEVFLAHPQASERCLIKTDMELLRKCAESRRFGSCRLGYYQDILLHEKDTQFAAMTFQLSNDTSAVVYRGTDSTMTGWREDLNMSYRETVPAQILAKDYIVKLAQTTDRPLYVTGHSKGGNLAVYAAAKCGEKIQNQILKVQNNDGPGFHQTMMEDPDYQRILPKIRTWVPQSSVVGLLLEHEEPYTVVKSKQLGILQHEAYTWQVLGPDFVHEEGLTEESKAFDRAMKKWLSEMTIEERNIFVDSIFDLLQTSGADTTKDLKSPKKLVTLLKNYRADEQTKKLIRSELSNLILTAAKGSLKKSDSN